ncbi:MAG: chloride channel protein [Actinomycetota bacterium]
MSGSRLAERALDAIGVVFIAVVTALMADRLVAWFQQLVDFWCHQGGVVSAVIPAVGAVLALVIVRVAQVTPATADAYVLGVQSGQMDVRSAPARLLALIAGVGLGVPLGYEGPMVYFAGSLGAAGPRTLKRCERPYVLAAATAGVSMVIFAPLAAALFVSEVARRGRPKLADLPPLAVGAAAAWGVRRLMGESGGIVGDRSTIGFGAAIVAMIVIGLAGGVVGRMFVAVILLAKRYVIAFPRRMMLVAGTLLLAVPIAQLVTGTPVLFGSGKAMYQWATDGPPLGAIALLEVFIALVAVMVAGGVVGGLFLPMVSIGSTLGVVLAGWFTPGTSRAVVTAMGGCVLVAAAYGAPLTAVALGLSRLGWSSGTAALVIAVGLARAVAGEYSVSVYQDGRHVRS